MPTPPHSHVSSSSRCSFSIGSLELRFTLSLLLFIIICLLWAQQDMIALIVLMMFLMLVIGIVCRIVVLARYRPHLLYSMYFSSSSSHSLTDSDGVLIVPSSSNRLDISSALNLNPTHLRLALMDRDFTPNDYELLLGLDEELRSQQYTGINQSSIERLPTYQIPYNKIAETNTQTIQDELSADGITSTNHVDNSICAICLEPKLPGQLVRVLPCLHSFHADTCIDPWLRTQPTCPVDKFRIQL